MWRAWVRQLMLQQQHQHHLSQQLTRYCSTSQASSAASTTAAAAAAQAQTAQFSVAAAASTVAEAGELLSARSWMHKTIKQHNNMSTAEYLEYKRKSYVSKLTFWEKVYWVAGLIGVSLYAYRQFDWDGSKAAAAKAAKQKAEETAALRLEALPAYMAGKSFASEVAADDSPFEGATPAEIEALAARYKQERGGAQQQQHDAQRWQLPMFADDDPFEGMSPEEIDAYVKKQGGL